MAPEDLPRDVLLRIVRRFDMDTRVKAGVIGRLNPPAALRARIHMILVRRAHTIVTGDSNSEYFLAHPYLTYLTDVGRSEPSEWLHTWYHREYPLWHRTYTEWAQEGSPHSERWRRVLERLPPPQALEGQEGDHPGQP